MVPPTECRPAPLGKPDIPQAPGRSHQGQFIRRHLKWPADIRLYARSSQGRKQFDGLLPVRRHGVEVLFQEIGAEPLRHPVFGKKLEPFGALVRTEHQAIAFLADIAFNAFVPQDRHLRQALPLALDQLWNGIRDPILMDDRDRRNLQPSMAPVCLA